MVHFRTDVQDEGTVASAAESTVASTAEDKTEDFKVADPKFSGNPKAILAIGATAKSWLHQVNWTHSPLPLGLQFKYKAGNKSRTPLVQRCQHLQQRLAKRFRGRGRNDAAASSEMFFVSVLEGDLINQSVSRQMIHPGLYIAMKRKT